MLHQYFADKDEADALSVRLGGEEGAEQFGLYFLADAFASISNFKHQWRGRSSDGDFSVLLNAFGSILDDVDQDLFEQGRVQEYDRIFLA